MQSAPWLEAWFFMSLLVVPPQPPRIGLITSADERVHEVRLYAKRLRALIHLLAERNDHSRELAESIKLQGRRLASPRDEVVMYQTLLSLCGSARSAINRDGLMALAEAYRPSADPERIDALAADTCAELARLHAMVERELGLCVAPEKAILRAYKKARRCWRASNNQDIANLHCCRRWCKYLQYQFVMLGIAKSDQRYRSWAEVGSLLGERHDIHNALRVLASNNSQSSRLARQRLRRRELRLAERCKPLAEKLFGGALKSSQMRMVLPEWAP